MGCGQELSGPAQVSDATVVMHDQAPATDAHTGEAMALAVAVPFPTKRLRRDHVMLEDQILDKTAFSQS